MAPTRGGGGHGGAPTNDFRNRLLHSSKFDENDACAGGGGGWSLSKTLVQIINMTPVIGRDIFNFLVRLQSFNVTDTN